ncbi:MAG: N-6 DNA methylase [Candidatus Nitrotoga sp.]
MQPDSLLDEAKSWVAHLDGMGLSGSLIREIFAAFLLLRWADYQEAEQEAMAAFEERSFQPVLPARLHWRNWHDLNPPKMGCLVAQELCPYLGSLRDSHEDSLSTYLHALAEPLRRVCEVNFIYLADVVLWLARQPFETVHDRRQLLDLFDAVVSESASGFEGQHMTPPSVAKLAVALVDPRPGERVYDPCFGFAGFLTTAWIHAEQAGTSGFNRRGNMPLEVFGIDINSHAFLMGLTRLVLAGVEMPHLELGNSLEREPARSPSREGFDVIFANPPVGLKTAREPGRYDHFPIVTGDAIGLFIQHVLMQLKAQGRAIIAVPEGFLFQSGKMTELRRYLLERGHVEAVVGLPAGAFLPSTGVKGSLLLLRKENVGERVRMVDTSQMFEAPKRGRPATIRNPMIQQLAEIVRGQSSQHAWELSREDLAAADWDLTPRRREKGGLESLFATLDEMRADVSIALLSDCAQINGGRSINARDLTDEPDGERPVSYIRIKDIQKGVVHKGSSWISVNALPGIEPQWRVLAGDVLLSKSGTIGKAGIVRNGAVGGIAANGLYVVRVDQSRLDPGFLIAYLASAACQNWLAAQSRGTAIQHLNRSVLDQLGVPLPPLHLQQRAAAQFREFGTDALAFLIEATGAKELDRLAAWMSDISRRIPSFVDGIDEPPSLSLLEPLVASAEITRRWSQGDEISSQHQRWLIPLLDGFSTLQGVSQIPEGPSLLNVLQEAERNFQSASSQASGHLPVEAQGRELSEQLAAWLKAVASGLLAHAEITATPEINRLQAGTMVEFSVTAVNASALPLRNVRVETTPDWGGTSVAFLPEKQSFSLNLRGDVPKVIGTFILELRWSAKTLDGQNVEGELQLAFDVFESEAETSEKIELGGSPYVTGSPLEPRHGNDVFFGREDLIAQITRQIVANGNVVLLEGNRRSGKTSILKHLEGRSAIPGWLAVHASLQGAEGDKKSVGVPTPQVFRLIAVEIAKALVKLNIDTPLPDGNIIAAGGKALGVAQACRKGIGDEAPFSDFREYMELVLSVLKPLGLGLLLMLDEFDKLQEGIDSGVTSPQVPENIRFLIQTYPKFSAILTGSRRLKRLREEYWSALYGLGTSIPVTALNPESARRVVTEPVQGKLVYSTEAVDRVIGVTARQPYLMQCLCNRVFDYAVQTKARSITLSVVNSVTETLVRDNEHFASLWDYAGHGPKTGRYRRQMILFVCARSFKQGTHISFGSLHEMLLNQGVEASDEALAEDLAYLRELELIDLTGDIGDGHYCLTIPLMGDWIEQQQDAEVVASRARAEAEDEND